MTRAIVALLALMLSSSASASADFMTGRGIANGVFAIVSLPVSDVRDILPIGLKPAPEMTLAADLYPVVVFAGEQKVDFVGTYLEAAMTLTVEGPYSKEARYTYTAKIVVDSMPALLAGRALGYPKRMAKLHRTDDTFTGSYSSKKPTLAITLEDIDDYDDESFKRNLEFVAGRVYPTIGKTKLGFVCFDFEWDFASAKVAPVNAKVELFESFSGPRLAGTHLSRRMDQTPYGAMRIISSWSLKNLRSCK